VDCGSPLWGALSLTPLPRGSNERVVVRNTSAAWLDLYGYALDVPGGMVAFDRGTVLAPGAHRVVRVPGRHRLPDRGGAVRAVTFSDVALACTAWGRGRCR
jgi:P pilus assembly chaperone PapD